jgi:LppP/LprE lipoprotein
VRGLPLSATAICAFALFAAPAGHADPGDPCGPDQATAMNLAIAHTPHDDRSQAPWNPAPVGGGNFDSCANLSAVVVSIDNPRPTSPRQGFLFHRGVFVGTALWQSRPYLTLDAKASTPDQVVLVAISGRTCATCNDGAASILHYKWDGVRPVMLDPMPPPQDWP